MLIRKHNSYHSPLTHYSDQLHHKKTYRSLHGVLQKIDGKMDVKVELQLLGKGVTIPDGAGNVLFPQIEEHFLGSVVKRSNEVLLWRRHQTEAQSWVSFLPSPKILTALPISHTLTVPPKRFQHAQAAAFFTNWEHFDYQQKF